MPTAQKLAILRKFSYFFFAGISLQWFTKMAPTPEKSESLWFAVPAFLVFLAMVAGMISWGSFFRSKIKATFATGTEEGLFDLAVGSAFLSFAAYVLTAVGLFSSATGSVLWLVLALGFALAPTLRPASWFNFGTGFFSKFLMWLIPIIVLGKLIEGIQFHQHGDAYVTYLAAPRTWAVSGNFQDYLKYSQFFLSTSWEALFAWGTALMGFTGGNGLDVSQWFSQWVTGGIGVFGVLLACLAFAQRLSKTFPLQAKWFPMIAIVALQVPGIRWTQNLAKNDYGIAFWGMSAFFMSMYLAPFSPVLAFFAGFVAGTSVVGKFTLAVLGICSGINILIYARKNVLPFIVGGILGIAPVILRNFILTKNPVFPWLPNVFPSDLLNEYSAHGAMAATSKAFHMADFPMYMNELYQESHLILVLILMLLWKKYFKATLKWIALPLLSFLLFTIAFRASTGIRYQGPTLFLLVFTAAYFTFFLVEQIAEKFLKSKRDWATGVLALAMLATANLTFFTFFQIGKPAKFNTFSKIMVGTNQIGGPSKVWIRQNIDPSKSILSFGDVHIFYLVDYPLTEVGQSADFGARIAASTEAEAEQIFKTADYDYFYIASDDYFKDDSYSKDQQMIAGIVERSKNWDQKCKKFDNSHAQVWDLHCLNPI